MRNYIPQNNSYKKSFFKFLLNVKHGRPIISYIKLVGVIALKHWYVINHSWPKFNFNLNH